MGAANGVLSTARRGAAKGAGGGLLGAGGAVAAGMVALATGAEPAEPGPPDGEAGGGGGGMVPWPNSAGDAEGEDGSDNGVAAAI